MNSKLILFSSATGSRVDRATGTLKGVSVITKGEAKGHDLVIDDLCLSQVMACAMTYQDGLRVKMDHGTGIDALVGTLVNFTLNGNKVRADLQLLKSHDDYEKILEMAENIPGSFGLSITFSGTPEEIAWPVADDEMSNSQSEEEDEDQETDENPVAQPSEDDVTSTNDGILPEDIFASEGEKSPKTMVRMAARCLEIYSCDIVDMPAANPTGLFSQNRAEIAQDAQDEMPAPDNGSPSDDDQETAPETPVDVVTDPGNDSMPAVMEEEDMKQEIPAADDGPVPQDEKLPSQDPEPVIPEEEVSVAKEEDVEMGVVQTAQVLVTRLGEFEGKIVRLESAVELHTFELNKKEGEITELRAKLAAADAGIAERDAALAAEADRLKKLSELHHQLKRSMGLLPAVNVPDVAFNEEIKRSEDFRAEYASIKDPSARAAYFKENYNRLVD